MKKAESKNKKRTGQSGEDGNSQLRTKAIKIHFSPLEFEKLTKGYGDSSETTLGSFCRKKLLNAPVSRTASRQAIAENAQILYELHKIGTNINQIAKRVNALKSDYPELAYQLQETLEEIKDIRLKVKQ